MAINIQTGSLTQNAKILVGLKTGSPLMVLNQNLSLVQPDAYIKVDDGEAIEAIEFSLQMENDEAFIYIMQPYEFNEFKNGKNETVALETAPNEADIYISKLSPIDYNTFTKNWTEVWMLRKNKPKHLGSNRSVVKTDWFEDGYYYIVWFKERVNSSSEIINAYNFNLQLKTVGPVEGTGTFEYLDINGDDTQQELSLKVTVTGKITFENTVDKEQIDVSFYDIESNEFLVSGKADKGEDGAFEFTLEYLSKISEYTIKIYTPEENAKFINVSPSYKYFTGVFSENAPTTSDSINELTWMLINGTLYWKDINNNDQPYTEKVTAYLSEKGKEDATRSNLIGPFSLNYQTVTNEDGTESNVHYGQMQGLGPEKSYYLYVAQENLTISAFTLGEEPCLAEDTLITMADGSEKQIQHVVVGDYILSKDKTAARVTKVRKTYGQTYHTLYTFEDGTIIDETGPHCFYNLEQDYWVTLEKWKIGEHCIDINRNAVALMSKERIEEPKKQCGLWVDGNTYFANGLLSGSAEYNLNLLEEIDLDKAVEMMNTVDLGRLLKYMKPEEYSE